MTETHVSHLYITYMLYIYLVRCFYMVFRTQARIFNSQQQMLFGIIYNSVFDVNNLHDMFRKTTYEIYVTYTFNMYRSQICLPPIERTQRYSQTIIWWMRKGRVVQILETSIYVEPLWEWYIFMLISYLGFFECMREFWVVRRVRNSSDN